MRNQSGRWALLLSFFIFLAVGIKLFYKNDVPEKILLTSTPVTLLNAFPYLQFNQPLGLKDPHDGRGRLFVIEQYGMIYTIENSSEAKEKKIFLDLTKDVRTGHSEEGLLGMTFHPQYKDNGYFFVDYIADHPARTVVARYQRSKNNPDAADPFSKRVILEIVQPYGNHNGGDLAFGPDGYLYITLGDGGDSGDPHGHGQNRKTYLGSILRIDVDTTDKDLPYSIPAQNPFVGNKEGYREEIFAYGLRNPWRMSFDSKTGWLWAGDVGQDKPNEEVNIIERGKNYGWNIMEGFDCFKPPQGCSIAGLTLPVWSYSKESGRSITGGFVYRGKAIHELKGAYIYADFVSGRVWMLRYDKIHFPENHLILHNPDLYPSSFGEDKNGELYICSFDGNIYKLMPK